MKYYIIAGEPSGDLHASNLMSEILKLDAEADFRFWGGDLMQSVGGTLVKHYRELAFMGVFAVVTNLGTIFKNIRFCKKDIKEFNPDVVIFVDYPGFNVRISKFTKKEGITSFYYIAPKVWAWNTGRVYELKKNLDKIFSILPFEIPFFKKYGVEVEYAGNPVLDAVEARLNKDETFDEFVSRTGLENKPIVAILAGSRREELQRMLPDMLAMVPKFANYQFVIAGAPSFKIADYEPFIAGLDVKVLFAETYQILQHSRGAMVTSGTATLETALMNTPQVVCYRMWGGKTSDWLLHKFILKVEFISLVNLILNRNAVEELFQTKFTLQALETELNLILTEGTRRMQLLADYKELKSIMGEPGTSKITAKKMVDYLKSIKS